MVEEMFQKVLDPWFPVPKEWAHSDAPMTKPMNLFKEIPLWDIENENGDKEMHGATSSYHEEL